MLESRKQLSALGALLAQAFVALVLLLGAGIPALAQQGQPAQPAQGFNPRKVNLLKEILHSRRRPLRILLRKTAPSPSNFRPIRFGRTIS